MWTRHKTLSLGSKSARTEFIVFAVQVVLICGAGSDQCIAAVYIVEEVGLLVELDPGLEFPYRLAETKGTLRQSRVCSIRLQHARAG